MLSKNELLNAKKLDVNNHDLPYNLNFEILKFEVSPSEYSTQSYISFNNRFTSKQLDYLKELENGSTFFITNIQVKTPLDTIITIDPVSFIVSK